MYVTINKTYVEICHRVGKNNGRTAILRSTIGLKAKVFAKKNCSQFPCIREKKHD